MLKRLALITALIVCLCSGTVAFASEEATTSIEIVTVKEDSEEKDDSKISWKTVVMLIVVGCGAVDVYMSGHKNKGDQQE